MALDGNLDDAVWSRAQPFDEFWELFPQDKVKPRVRTEARFAYDKTSLYVAVRAHDPDLSQLREPFARRDNVLADQDMIVLFVDPVGTSKFAHFFRVNPRGSIGDGLYNEDSGSEDFSPGHRVRGRDRALRRRLDRGIPHPVLVAALRRPAVVHVERAGLPQLPARPALPHRLGTAAARAELLHLPQQPAHRPRPTFPRPRTCR